MAGAMSLKALDRASLLLKRNHTLGTIMERLAKVNGRRRLVEEAGGGLQLTYVQASKRVNRWAGGIAAKIEPGDRVVIATPNGYEMLLLCLAASRAGGIPVPVNSQMRPDEVRHVIDDSSAALVLRTAAEVDGAPPLATAHPFDSNDVAALFYTSGTTGTPKGVQLTHQSLVGQVAMTGAMPTNMILRGEAVLGLPVAHIMGFVAVLGLACAGIPVYFLPKFRPDEALDAIESRHASIFIGVPAMYRMLLEAGAERRDLSSVRVWGSGADAMPPELAANVQAARCDGEPADRGSRRRGALLRGLRDGGDGRGRGGQGLAADAQRRLGRVARLPAAGLPVPRDR